MAIHRRSGASKTRVVERNVSPLEDDKQHSHTLPLFPAVEISDILEL